MTLTEVEILLAARLGFDIETVGPQGMEAVIRQAMQEAGFSDPAAYARKLASDPRPWNYLVDNGS